MKQFFKATFVTSITAILLLPIAANAQEVSEGSTSSTTTPPTTTTRGSTAQQLKQTVEEQRQANKEKMEAVKTEAKQKLSDAKRKVCENHVNRANTIIGNMNERRQKAFDHITKVYDSVKTFYTDKKLTSADYDSLVASVESAKVAASTSMDSQLTTPTINCAGDHPRADISDFQAKRTGSVESMKTYRQSVKELIKAVKQAANESKS
ncbi:MAG: hypothetical protein WAW80_01180 [Candidatus Saccharimonadales bacterium]